MRHFKGHLSVDLVDYARNNSCTVVAFTSIGCIQETT